MTRARIEAELLEIVARETGKPCTLASRLADDLACDGLDHISIVLAAEDHFGVAIPDEIFDVLPPGTVGTLASAIATILEDQLAELP